MISFETPVPMKSGAKLALHIIPINAFDPASNLDITEIDSLYQKDGSIFCPAGLYLRDDNLGKKYNLDGILIRKFGYKNNVPNSYLQVFRNGIIENITTDFAREYNGNPTISPDYENELCNGMKRLLHLQKELNIEPPLFVFFSMIGVGKYVIFDAQLTIVTSPIDRDTLIIPEVMIENFDVDLFQVMKPIFDTVWNAAGYPRSLNYDEQGNWKGADK